MNKRKDILRADDFIAEHIEKDETSIGYKVKGQPNFAERVANNQHTCQFCLKTKPAEEFMPSTSRFWALGHINVCYSCLEEHIDYKDLNVVNRLLQFADIAFEPNEWIKLYNRENEGVFRHYAQLRHHKNYLTMDWSDQNKALIEKAKHGVLDAEIDATRPALITKLIRKWGDFEENDLLWLEDFYNEMASDYAVQSAADKGLLHTFAITSLQNNRLLKEGSFSKEIMTAYQNLLTSIKKTLEKDENDQITSIGELVGFLEEEGFQPKFYDGMTRDQADYIIEDTQRFLQNLIMNQVNIQDIVNNAAMQYAGEEGVEAMEEKLIDATRPPKERD